MIIRIQSLDCLLLVFIGHLTENFSKLAQMRRNWLHKLKEHSLRMKKKKSRNFWNLQEICCRLLTLGFFVLKSRSRTIFASSLNLWSNLFCWYMLFCQFAAMIVHILTTESNNITWRSYLKHNHVKPLHHTWFTIYVALIFDLIHHWLLWYHAQVWANTWALDSITGNGSLYIAMQTCTIT